jgi:hypothetical protein
MGLFGGGLFGGGLFGGGGLAGGSIRESVVRDPSRDHDFVREQIKHSDTLTGELLRTFDEAGEELQEILTDGVVEMGIKGNKDYKTSFEIRDEADAKVACASDRYYRRCDDFNKYLDNLNDKINRLYDRKVELAKRIGQEAEKLPNMPKISSKTNAPDYRQRVSTVSLIGKSVGIEWIFDMKGRKDSANEYLEDAKDYEVKIDKKIAEIGQTQGFLDIVNMNLDEEETLLNALDEALEKRKNLQYSKVEEQLHILISEYILGMDGKRNQKYMDAIEQLRKIC